MEKFIILVFFVGGAHGLSLFAETKCNMIQTPSPCSPVIGGSVYIQLMTNASSFSVSCKKLLSSGAIKVFSMSNEKVNIATAFRNRTEFLIDIGTLKITNLERSDSGQYNIDVYDHDGISKKKMEFSLDVKEDNSSIVILVCAALGGALLIALLCFCVCRKVMRHRKRDRGV